MVVSSCASRSMLHAPQSLPHAHAPRSMSCVSCSVVYDLCSMAYVHDLCFILCPLLHAPLSCSMFHVPCFMLHDPRAIPHAPWSLRYVSCSTLHDLSFMFRAPCFMPHAPCSYPMFMLWPTDSVPCPMFHASSHASSSIPHAPVSIRTKDQND